jgi:hypothetical protein
MPISSLRRSVPAVAAGLLLVLALAACGSSKQSASSSPSDAAFKFSRCMREHGIKDFPDPQVTGAAVKLSFRARPGQAGAPTRQKLDAAQRACRHFMAAVAPKLTPQEKAAREEQVLKFAACMRKHGVDVHASTAEGGAQIRVGGPDGGGPNPESPAFQAAQKACQGLLPFKGGGPGVTSQKGGSDKPSLSLGG